MSSKVKSEKTKVKFAQSNINHVYKGNATETQHKPTVRPPGIQLLAKLQGTRRLPPPAWVPSLKAETGGLDTRVTLVPPGGGGWGAPSTTSASDTPATQNTEATNSATTNSFPTVNGSATRDLISASLEPAYAKAGFPTGQSTSTAPQSEKPFFHRTTPSADKEPSEPVVNGLEELNAKSSSSTQGSVQSQDSSLPPRSESEKSGVGGGLAANKPFFQRPAPVPVTTSKSKTGTTTTTTPKTEGGAREVVGEPSGWAAVDQEEPDFEEQILFSDEDEPVEESKSTTQSASNQASEIKDPTNAVPSFSGSVNKPATAANTTTPGKPFAPSVSDLSHPTAPFTSRPQSIYMDNSNLVASDTWSSSDLPFNCLAGQPLPRHPTPNLPYRVPSIGPQRVGGNEVNRLMTDAQFLQHPVPAHGFPDSFFPAQLSQGRMVTPASSNFVDSIRSTGDMDTELQQAQRHARLQEFESAIERAQQARVARQKLSENCSIESENLLQKSMKLTSDASDNRSIPSVAGQISANAAQVAANLLLASNNHPPASILNNISHQVLLSSAFHQSAGQNRSDLVAAVAAATAAAMAYPGAATSAPNKSSMDVSSNPQMNPPHSHNAPLPVASSNSMPASSWHGPFVPPASVASSAPGVMSQQQPQPPIPQLLQNAFQMSAAGTHVPKQPFQQGVFVDPDFFVERFLELFNQQQQQQQTTFSNKNVSSSDTAVQASSDVPSSYPPAATNESIPNLNRSAIFVGENTAAGGTMFQDGKEAEPKSTTKSQRIIQPTSESGSVESPGKTNRVPGLMDVKVTGATTNLSHLWDKDDYLCDNSFRGGGSGAIRGGRAKGSWFKNSRGSTRTRPSGRPQNITRTTENSDGRPTNAESDSSNKQHKIDSTFHRMWPNSKLRAQPHKTENQLISSHRNARSNEDLPGEEFSNRLNDDKNWSRPELGMNEKPGLDSSCSDTEAGGDLDVTDKHNPDWDDKQDRDHHDHSNSLDHRSADKVRRPDQDVQDTKDSSMSYRGDYNRRGRRGWPNVGAQFTSSSRKYNTDEGAGYGGRYSKDSDTHSKYPYNGPTGHRGYRGGSSTNPMPTVNKNRVGGEDNAYRPADRGSRNTYSRGFTGYFFGRNTQSQTYHDRDGYSRDHTTQSYADNRFNTSDTRRPARAAKSRPGLKGQFSNTAEYYSDYHYSDDEDGMSTHRRNQNHDLAGSSVRNRSHESSNRLNRGSYRKQNNPPTTYKNTESIDLPDPGAADQFTKEPPKQTSDEYDDSDIPTVRVPASDSLAYARQQYSYSSTNRSGGMHRGSGAARRNNRSNQAHQQSKRSEDSNNQGSKRYRDQRDRYHDEKDGDGGAAAGGTGRSATGGGSSSTNVRSDNSGTGGGSRASGNQCGGGHSDSTAADSPNDQMPQLSVDTNDASNSASTVIAVDVVSGTQTSSNINNTSSSHSSSGYGRHRSMFTTPGNISDANDADEWETASEGSPGAISVSSPSPHLSSDSRFHASQHDGVIQAPTLTSTVVVPPNTNQTANSINIPTRTAPDVPSVNDFSKTISNSKNIFLRDEDTSTDVPKPAPRSREANTGCHVAAENECSHYRRDNDDGSGGASGGRGGTVGSSDISSFSNSLAPSTNSNRKDKYNSGTGGRINNNQEFHRKTYGSGGRSYYPTQSRRAHPNIPPLMSIKPQGPFAENQYDFDSMNWDCCSEKDRIFAAAGDNTDKSSQPVLTVDQTSPKEDLDDGTNSDTVPADGFTKVVSKASKNLARRRMQQELSNGVKAVPRKPDDQKLTGNVVRPEDGQATGKLNHTIKPNASSVKTTPKKIKSLPQKMTFLGPPMCLVTTASSLSPPKPEQVISTVSAIGPSARLISVSTTRTWSKVVGTKSTSTSGSANVTVTSSSPSTTPSLNSNRAWQVEPIKQSVAGSTATTTNGVTTTTGSITTKMDAAGAKSPEAFAPLNTVNESKKLPTTSESIVSCTYTSMQSLWSTGDSIGKVEPQTPRLLLPPAPVSTTAVSNVLGTTSPSSASVTQASNNICKVKPQQQQQPFQVNTTASSSVLPPSAALQLTTPLSPIMNANDTVGCTHACATDLSPERDRQDYECNSDIDRSGPVLRQLSTEVPPSSLASRLAPSWNSSGTIYSPFSGPQLSNVHVHSNTDNALSTSTWPIIEQPLDAGVTCIPGNYNANSNPSPYPHPMSSNVLSNLFASNSGIQSMDNLNKPSHATAPNPRHPSQTLQPYQHSMLPSSDQMGLYSNSPYGNSAVDVSKLSSSNLGVGPQQVTFASASVYMHPQQQANNQTQHNRSYPSIALHQPSQIHQSQKCRQRLTQQVDPTTYATMPAFPPDLQNEYTFLPSAAGCVQPPTGGLYSSVHGQSQPPYAQNQGRHGIGPPAASPWSLLGNPNASNPQGGSQGYVPTLAHTAGAGGGLLPHPMPQGGYGNPQCHFPNSASNPGSTFTTPPNYVGVIGGGRPHTDQSNNSSRQRGIQHHNLYQHPNLRQSPTAQGQQSFQLHSAFYPSLSPSHQRIPLQQFGDTQGRGTVQAHLNPQSGLYAAAFGAPTHHNNQPTPPPIGHQVNPINFFNTQFQFPSRPDGLH